MNQMYREARNSSKLLNTKGIHPNNKIGLTQSISAYKSALKRDALDGMFDSVVISPINSFTSNTLTSGLNFIFGW